MEQGRQRECFRWELRMDELPHEPFARLRGQVFDRRLAIHTGQQQHKDKAPVNNRRTRAQRARPPLLVEGRATVWLLVGGPPRVWDQLVSGFCVGIPSRSCTRLSS